MHGVVRGEVGVLRLEGAAPGGRVHEYRPQREDIDGGADLAGAAELLRCHERRRAHHHARLGADITAGRARDAEVDDACRPVVALALQQEHIARLEVPVHDLRTVDLTQCLGEFGAQAAQRPPVQRPRLGDPVGECAARDERGCHPRSFRVRVGVHDRRGERTADPARGHDLLPEPRPELGIVGIPRVYDLDGDGPPRGRPAEIDDAHAAGPDPRFDPVAADRPRIVLAQGHRVSFTRSRLGGSGADLPDRFFLTGTLHSSARSPGRPVARALPVNATRAHGSGPRAAVDPQDRAGHVGGAVAEQPGGGLGDLVRVGRAAQRGRAR